MTWPTVALGEACKVIAGGTPKRAESEYWGGEIPWVKISDMLQGVITETDEKITRRGLEKSAAKLLPPGTVLVSIFATIGRTAILGCEAATNQAIVGVVPKREGQFDERFLEYCLRQKTKELERKARGVAQANINGGMLKLTELPLPPLPEQKRIAGILDAADALRAKRRESLAQLDTLLKSTFFDMFGDPVTNPMGWEMGVIGDLLASANYGTSKKADSDEGEYPILRMNNITYSGEWDLSSLKYIDLEKKDLPKHLVHRGQILFNRTNSKELVGKTAVYRRNESMAFAGYLVRGIVNELADAEYIGAFMNTAQMKQFLRNKCKSIVGMANINAREFQSIPIPKPPISLQRRFATIVESVEHQKARMRSHLAELDALFASLQSRAFAGAL